MANEKMREYWSSSGAIVWVRHRRLFDAELAPFAEAVVDTIAPAPGDRVLDIGCGTGTLLELATGRGATGLGIDISPAMIEAAAERVPTASFRVGDAQTDDLVGIGALFDAAVSRFGVMFFEDPVAAFTNVRRAVRVDGRLAFTCWRSPAENAIFTLGTSVLLDAIDSRPDPPAPDAPGPHSFADPDRVRELLAEAGWSGIAVEPFDAVCDYGIDGSDGVEERLTMILGTSAGLFARRALEESGRGDEWEGLLDEVRAELRRNLVDGRVQFVGATWLVTAYNPG